MEKSCPKYPLMKMLGIQQTILIYAMESYGPILYGLEESDSETAEVMINFIEQQLAAIKILRDKTRKHFEQVDHLTNQKCELDFLDDLDITCYPVGNDESHCGKIKTADFLDEMEFDLNIWEV